MNKVKASIIVPVYNAEKYLEKCLNSIMNQTFSEFEVILIDDGSPDHSGEICDNFAEQDHRFRVFHQKNLGVGPTRMKGLQYARGDYIFWVDADDYAAPNLLERIIPYFEEKKADIVVYGYFALGEGQNGKHNYQIDQFSSEQWKELALKGKLGTIWKMASRHSLWKGITVPHELRRNGEDGYMTLYIMERAEKIANCPEILYYHRIDSKGSIRHSYSGETYLGSFYTWYYRGMLSRKIAPHLTTYCGKRVISNGVKAYCLGLVIGDLSKEELNEISLTLHKIEDWKITGRIKYKVLGWFIRHHIEMPCVLYGKYKINKLRSRNHSLNR